MWPGSDLPVGPPPPSQQPPRREIPPVRPIAGWYIVPGVLLVGALIMVIVAFIANWDATEAADGPTADGDARTGVQVVMTGGHTYRIHVETGGSRPTSCTVTPEGGEAVPVALTYSGSFSATVQPGHTYAASFDAPFTTTAELTCRGTNKDVLVVPDDNVYGFIGLWFIVAMFVGFAAVLAFILILVMRVNSAKRRRQAMAAPPGSPHHPYRPY
jgi:hypothetical protein